MEMNHVDIILAIPLTIGAIRGFYKGFISQAASLIGLIAGIYMAVLFANILGNIFIEHLDWSPHAVKILAFVIVFIIVMIIVNLVARIIEKFFKLVGLNFFNRLAGLGAGVIKMAFILSVVLIFFNYLNRENLLMSDETRESSFLYPKVEAIVPWLLPSDSFINVGIAIDRIKSITDEE